MIMLFYFLMCMRSVYSGLQYCHTLQFTDFCLSICRCLYLVTYFCTVSFLNSEAMADWKFSLVKSMDDPTSKVYSDDKIVIIKDKYPKSEYHYLVLPKEDISGIRSLNSSHLRILKYIDSRAREFVNGHHEGLVFWLGYHAVPSLQRLHLHIISDDFKSTALKTAKHWNSFTTCFFLPSSRIIKDIENHGKVELLSESECKQYLKSRLKCHKCKYEPTNMPDLKTHLNKNH